MIRSRASLARLDAGTGTRFVRRSSRFAAIDYYIFTIVFRSYTIIISSSLLCGDEVGRSFARIATVQDVRAGVRTTVGGEWT